MHDALCDIVGSTGGAAHVKQVGMHGRPAIARRWLNWSLRTERRGSSLMCNPRWLDKIVLKHVKPKGIVRPIRYAFSRALDWLQSDEERDVLEKHYARRH